VTIIGKFGSRLARIAAIGSMALAGSCHGWPLDPPPAQATLAVCPAAQTDNTSSLLGILGGTVSLDGSSTDITFTVPRADLARAVERLERAKAELKFAEVKADTNVAKVSVIGVGMRSHAGVALKMFETLAAKGINIQVISTSEIKVSVLVAAEYTELAVRALHTAYELDAP